MDESNLHPSVREFKYFINKHPKLRTEIRKSGSSWQEYYEKWVLLGEDDPYWKTFLEEEKEEKEEKGEKKHSELFGQLMKMTENIDLDKVQDQVGQLSSTINIVNELLNDFLKTKKPQQRRNPHVFDMFRD